MQALFASICGRDKSLPYEKNMPILVYRGVSLGFVGAAIGRPPTNCNAICWFSAGKQSIIALRRCDFVKQNHADERCSPLLSLTQLPEKWQFVGLQGTTHELFLGDLQ